MKIFSTSADFKGLKKSWGRSEPIYVMKSFRKEYFFHGPGQDILKIVAQFQYEWFLNNDKNKGASQNKNALS